MNETATRRRPPKPSLLDAAPMGSQVSCGDGHHGKEHGQLNPTKGNRQAEESRRACGEDAPKRENQHHLRNLPSGSRHQEGEQQEQVLRPKHRADAAPEEAVPGRRIGIWRGISRRGYGPLGSGHMLKGVGDVEEVIWFLQGKNRRMPNQIPFPSPKLSDELVVRAQLNEDISGNLHLARPVRDASPEGELEQELMPVGLNDR
jgi:hypothetical protein